MRTMSDRVIRVEGLGKKYRIGRHRGPYRTLREAVRDAVVGVGRRAQAVLRGRAAVGSQQDFWALKDVSFEVSRGEVVGVIGRNGAGKSTLLKILSRITHPSEGEVRLRGRVGALLEVGTGFHPELTGRDNIYLNGALLGMKRADIRRRFDAIVEFAEIGQFIDTPVKHYSSGMYMRLAFSVAAHLEPELLIIDEVLAVGDAVFQQRCLRKMDDLSRGGRTVLFVSHSMPAIRGLCSRAIWMDTGRVRMDGPVDRVTTEYLGGASEDSTAVVTDGIHGLTITRVVVVDSGGRPTNALRFGDEVRIDIHFRADRPIHRPYFWLALRCQHGTFAGANMLADGHAPELIEGEGVIGCRFTDLHLFPQLYTVGVGARMPDGATLLVRSADATSFYITGGPADVGLAGAFAARELMESTPCAIEYEWTWPDGRINSYTLPERG